mmetsp:Transcript_25809/g.48997  ORF Transcript_25809/g.48997 Transcript_25809/m.48997 type:complete len:259 (-) Transcript_25809:503-1279(-)
MYAPFTTSPSADKPAKMSRWLTGLLGAKFFEACHKHPALKKNERNYYCLDCRGNTFCQHCLGLHQGHEVLQVRRYVYHDVVRVQDLEKHLDCKSIQTYIINGANVVFLRERPQPKPIKTHSKQCHTCHRSLQDNYRYCSLACKMTAVSGAPRIKRARTEAPEPEPPSTPSAISSLGEGDASGEEVDQEAQRPPRRRRTAALTQAHNHSQHLHEHQKYPHHEHHLHRLLLLSSIPTPPSPTPSTPSRRKSSTPTRSPFV